jgi:L-threonylcarbamoyladenylate synthase
MIDQSDTPPRELRATVVLRVDPAAPDARVIQRAAAAIRAGELVAFPTETVYGLGADALDERAVARIFEAKGRPPRNPLIVHVAGAEAARALVQDWPATAEQLTRRFWPGPLTLVLRKAARVPALVTGEGDTVAIRAPAHAVALALLRAAETPIAAPSANRSTRVSPTRAEHVLGGLAGRIDLLLDGGPTPGGIESTVLDLVSAAPRVLRPGLIPPSDLEAILGPILRPSEGLRAPRAEEAARAPVTAAAPRSPGTLGRHYAPIAALECVTGSGRDRVESHRQRGLRVGWLTFDAAARSVERAHLVVMPADARAYAARLYAELYALDEAGVQRIVVELPPATDEWLAIRDRLTRAGTDEGAL